MALAGLFCICVTFRRIPLNQLARVFYSAADEREVQCRLPLLAWILIGMVCVFSLLCLGCGRTSELKAIPGTALSGIVHGGQQPVTGSKIQLYAVGTSGDASTATPLISATVTTSDGSGNASNTNANAGNGFNSMPAGAFTITGDYQCPSAQTELYLASSGGNPGLAAGTDNHAIALVAALGMCGTLSSTTYISMNEVTTVGSVAPLIAFMNSTSALGSGAADLPQLQAAFAQVNDYTNIALGTAPGPALPSGYTESSTALITLGDVLATCINSAGGVANDGSMCGQLFSSATPAGGIAPTDTVGAILNILKNPTSNVAAIYGLLGSNAPFQPTLASAPASWALTITAPAGVSTPPIILNSSDTGIPGDVVYLQGDRFGSSPQVYFYRVSGNEPSLASPTGLGATLLTPITGSNQALTVQLPTRVAMGLYALWVGSAGIYSAPVLVNQARGMQFEFAEVSPGYAFRIFGRNLLLPGATPQVTFVNGNTTLQATVVTGYANDGNILQVTAPTGVAAGTIYTVNVSNGYGQGSGNYDVNASDQTIVGRVGTGATCGGLVVATPDVFGLGVPWGADFACVGADVINVVTSINPHTHLAYGADPSGVVNSVNAIQQALYDAGNATLHAHGATVMMPAGNFLINLSGENATFFGIDGKTLTQPAYTEIQVPSNTVLAGTLAGGTIETTITDATNGLTSTKNVGITNVATPTLLGLTNFVYQQTGTAATTTTPPLIIMTGSSAFISNVTLHFAHSVAPQANGGQMIMGGGGSHNMLAQNIQLDHGLFSMQSSVGVATYGIVRNNIITDHGSWFRTRVELGGIQNMLIEGNTFTRDGNYPGSDAYEQGGIEAGPSPYVVVLNNIFNAVNLPLEYSNDGETILVQTQPAAGTQTGTATGATATTLTDSTASFVPGALVGQTVAITFGTGTGSSGTVTANTATTITVASAWAVNPTAGSRYVANVNSYDYGAVSAATATTLTGVSYSGLGTYFPTGGTGLVGANAVVEIIQGPGTGQVRSIASNNVNTVTITQPWAEIPTTASVYAITGPGADRWLVKGNQLSDQPRGIVFYTGSHDSVVAGNTLINTGETIYLRGDQRPTLGAGWYGRFNPTYKTLVSDNVLLDTTGKWAAYAASTFYPINGATQNSIVGTAMIGQEYRRNVQQGFGSTQDGATAEVEGFANNLILASSAYTYTDPGYAGLLGTIFDDNTTIKTTNAYRLSTGSYQTTIWDSVLLNDTTVVRDDILKSAGHAATGTVSGMDAGAVVFESSFSGTGTSTGPGNLVDLGGTGQTVQAAGQTAAVAADNAFDSQSGSYLHVAWPGAGAGGTGLQTTPVSGRTSWSRIFDQRSQQWIVNGGFDFFLRPGQNYSASLDMKALDLGTAGTNSMEMVFSYVQPNQIQLQIVTPAGGGGGTITGTYPAGFAAGAVYHLGVTFSTDVTKSPALTTAKIFVVAGSGAITTTNPIGTGTFSLNSAVVNDKSSASWFNGGPWIFGGGYGPLGTTITNDFDGLKLYYTDPGTFQALDAQ
jgi:hypothetical protein